MDIGASDVAVRLRGVTKVYDTGVSAYFRVSAQRGWFGMDPAFLERHWNDLPNLNRLRQSGDFKRLGHACISARPQLTTDGRRSRFF